jgi:hypothetical protein
MKKYNLYFLTCIFVLFFLNACNKDDGSTKQNFFSYGLLGVTPLWVPDDSGNYVKSNSDDYWVYIRAFGHADYKNVKAELSHGDDIISLGADNQYSDIFFTEGSLNFSFAPNDSYGVRMWDKEHEYTGTITTLPRLNITSSNLVSNEINLEWSDAGADFYDVEFGSAGVEKHFLVEDTHYTLNLNEVDYESENYAYITIAGFKGFNPLSNTEGNMAGCHGYLFGYTYDYIELDPATSTFKQVRKISKPDLDAYMLSQYKNRILQQESNNVSELEYTFTYGYIYSSGYSPSANNSFHGTTLIEPANALDNYRAFMDGHELNTYSWNGFLRGIESKDKIYDEFDQDREFNFELTLNEKTESVNILVPDTFSIVSAPSTLYIPTAPFEIVWRKPVNADYFFIDLSWYDNENSVNNNYFYVTEDNRYLVTQMPDNVESGSIRIVAVNGSNPMVSNKPNLKELNGYIYSLRISRNILYYDNNGKKAAKQMISTATDEDSYASYKRLNNYVISALAKNNPRLKRHQTDLLNQLNQK